MSKDLGLLPMTPQAGHCARAASQAVLKELLGKGLALPPFRKFLLAFALMSFRLIGLTLAISLTVFGCANSRTDSASDARIWRAQLQRQQEVVRDQGRIGYIGYEGPSSR
jgi:hypothetical protein